MLRSNRIKLDYTKNISMTLDELEKLSGHIKKFP